MQSPEYGYTHTQLNRRKVLKGGVAVGLNLVLQTLLPHPIPSASGGSPGTEEIIKKKIQENLQRPTPYRTHAFKYGIQVGDIDLGNIRLLTAIFCPKEESIDLSIVAPSLELMLRKVSTFWENALDKKVKISPELIPYVFLGRKPADQYNFSEIMDELEIGFQNQIKDPVLLRKCVSTLNNNRQEEFPSNNGEFFDLGVLIIHGNNGNNWYRYGSSGDIGLFYMPGTYDRFQNWASGKADNEYAHEMGHSLGLPDQYPFDPSTGSLPNEWYDPDPYNIMGSGMFDHDLTNLHLAISTKRWMINRIPPYESRFPLIYK